MIEELIPQYHPSTHRVLTRWLETGDTHVRANHLHAAQHYPAFALARAYDVAHPRAIALSYAADVPLEKIRKASRIGIGPEVPASRLRVRMGRKYPIVFVAPEDQKGEA
jgi:hypothetical protein